VSTQDKPVAASAVEVEVETVQPTITFDKSSIPPEDRYYYASQWELIWWRFSRHKVALFAAGMIILLYLGALFADFVSPYSMDRRFEGFQAAPPTRIHLIRPDGGIQLYVFGMQRQLDQKTFKWTYTEDTSQIYPIKFFVRGDEYKWFGLVKTNVHLFGAEGAPIFLFGTDRLSRDLFTRTWFGARISLSIGLVGVFLSFVLGVILGGISGYFGGVVDDAIQRVIDFLLAIPGLPLWMTLSAALPRDWPTLKMYFAITIILSILGWCGLARVVRGKILQLREEDYTLAALGAGASDWRIITRHLLPGFTSHLIVSITFSIPAMILNETALSFIGLGIQPPAVSWGTLLQDAQNLTAVAQQAWLLIPALFVIGTVIMFNFVGDGLRDAADPYER
jgi:peptide/nickel transport system permease protein